MQNKTIHSITGCWQSWSLCNFFFSYAVPAMQRHQRNVRLNSSSIVLPLFSYVCFFCNYTAPMLHKQLNLHIPAIKETVLPESCHRLWYDWHHEPWQYMQDYDIVSIRSGWVYHRLSHGNRSFSVLRSLLFFSDCFSRLQLIFWFFLYIIMIFFLYDRKTPL